MFTPDALNLWGNTLGNLGYLAFFALGVALLLHAVTLSSYGRLADAHSAPGGKPHALRGLWGRRLTDLVLFRGRVPLAMGLATGLLVSAGFVFNEVLVYWFPNFAFAYLLLALAVVLNLLGERAVRWGQAVALVVVLAGLAVLVGSGLTGGPSRGIDATPPPNLSWPHLAVGVVVLMGFDLVFPGRAHPRSARRGLWRATAFALALGGLALALWGWVVLDTVPRSRLAGTTISHLIAARTLLDQPGRLIMAAVVIGGVLAAVNALLFGVSRLIIGLIRRHTPALGMALAMSGGWAGEPVLETFIRAGTLFWLFQQVVVNLSAWRLPSGRRSAAGRGGPRRNSWLPAMAAAGLLFSMAALVLMEPDRAALARMAVALPVVAGVVLWAADRLLNREKLTFGGHRRWIAVRPTRTKENKR